MKKHSLFFLCLIVALSIFLVGCERLDAFGTTNDEYKNANANLTGDMGVGVFEDNDGVSPPELPA